MNIDLLRHIGLFCLLVLLHTLVLMHVHLLGVATPMLYIYVVSTLRRGYPRWATLLWGFAMGVTVDAAQNTPGMTAATLTLTAALQPVLVEMFTPRDADANMPTTAHSMGWGSWTAYMLSLLFVHCLTYFTVEFFSFFDIWRWAGCVVGSTLLSFLIAAAVELAHAGTHHQR